MAIYSSLLLASLALGARASNSTTFVSEPHKYFTTKIRQESDKADSISPDAITYPAKYPSIDISPWIHLSSTTDDERLQVVYEVLEQAMGAGSFNIIGHDCTFDLLDRLESSTAKFFSQSLEHKRQFSSDHPKSGYVGNLEERYGQTVYKSDNPREQEGDMREIFSLMYPSSLDDNVQAPSYFQNSLDEYLEQLQTIETALSHIFSTALGLAKGVSLPLDFFEKDSRGRDSHTSGVLRAFKYPSMPAEYDDAKRLVPHMDFGTATIIFGSEKGLEEIRNGRWYDVPINKEKGELHVTVGETLAMWSNELFKSNIHRVGKTAAKDRISFAYFLGQGNKEQEGGDGIDPVCTEGEFARFPRTSAEKHVNDYIAAQRSFESLA